MTAVDLSNPKSHDALMAIERAERRALVIYGDILLEHSGELDEDELAAFTAAWDHIGELWKAIARGDPLPV